MSKDLSQILNETPKNIKLFYQITETIIKKLENSKLFDKKGDYTANPNLDEKEILNIRTLCKYSETAIKNIENYEKMLVSDELAPEFYAIIKPRMDQRKNYFKNVCKSFPIDNKIKDLDEQGRLKLLETIDRGKIAISHYKTLEKTIESFNKTGYFDEFGNLKENLKLNESEVIILNSYKMYAKSGLDFLELYLSLVKKSSPLISEIIGKTLVEKSEYIRNIIKTVDLNK
jgi:hypothetical protein